MNKKAREFFLKNDSLYFTWILFLAQKISFAASKNDFFIQKYVLFKNQFFKVHKISEPQINYNVIF